MRIKDFKKLTVKPYTDEYEDTPSSLHETIIEFSNTGKMTIQYGDWYGENLGDGINTFSWDWRDDNKYPSAMTSGEGKPETIDEIIRMVNLLKSNYK